jgi:hypothetical protein
MANIVVQVRTVAVLTPVRTIRDVDRQGHLIRNFLENDVKIIIFHYKLKVEN